MTLNELYFRNPNRKNFRKLNTETYLDTLLTELTNYPYPENDSEQALTELNDLVVLTDGIANSPDLLKRFAAYDSNLEEAVVYALEKAGVNRAEVEKIVQDLKEDVGPLLVKVKYHYQRIRPYQLALYRNVPLYPFRSVAADSPSYPSGHAFQSSVYLQVLGNKYPAYYKLIHELTNDVIYSRMYLGLHFASDCDFAIYMAEAVANHPEFKKKYGL